MLGDYPRVVQDAVMDSLEVHNGLSEQILRDEKLAAKFANILLDVIIAERSQSGKAKRL